LIWLILLFLPDSEIPFYEGDKIPVDPFAIVLGHIQETLQQPIVDELGDQEKLTKGDIKILQIEGVKGLNGDVIQRTSPEGIVDQVGSQSCKEEMDKSIDPERVSFPGHVKSPDFDEKYTNQAEQDNIQKVGSLF